MIQRLRGIVLDSFKFKETSIVSTIYTYEHGMLSLLCSGLGKKQNGLSLLYFQPLSIIEFNTHFKDKKGLLRATEPSLVESPIGVAPDVRKYAVAQFIAEIVLRTCREKESDERLFDLLEEVVVCFRQGTNFQDVHLYFLTAYAELIGFSLKALDDISDMFLHTHYDVRTKEILNALNTMKSYHPLEINKNERSRLIKFIVYYLEKNIEMPKIKSLSILEEVFS